MPNIVHYIFCKKLYLCCFYFNWDFNIFYHKFTELNSDIYDRYLRCYFFSFTITRSSVNCKVIVFQLRKKRILLRLLAIFQFDYWLCFWLFFYQLSAHFFNSFFIYYQVNLQVEPIWFIGILKNMRQKSGA